METTTITLYTKFQIGQVDPRIFGGFLEHMGRAVYEGVYDPDSSCADEDGFRTDVMEAMRRLNMTAMRYPGGNFVSGYHWMDGVGQRGLAEAIGNLFLTFTQDDPCLALPLGLGLTRHGILQGFGNHDIAYLHRLDRYSPRCGTGINDPLQLGVHLLPAHQDVGQVHLANDFPQAVCAAQEMAAW
jgi:hypothetical protein